MTVQRVVCAIAVILAGLVIGEAQITVPTVFTTTVPVAQLNTNFSTIADGALNRTSGTITGNITVTNGVTVDGIDISAAMGAGATPAFTSMTLSSAGASALDVVGGINAGSGNVGIVDTSGRIPAINSTYVASLSGASLTGILPAAVSLNYTTRSFTAGDFTAGGTMVWTVAVGDYAGFYYGQLGNLFLMQTYVTTTTIAGTVNPELRVLIPNGKTVAANATGSFGFLDNGTAGTGVWVAAAGATYVSLFKDGTTATTWTLSPTDLTQIRLTAIFWVT